MLPQCFLSQQKFCQFFAKTEQYSLQQLKQKHGHEQHICYMNINISNIIITHRGIAEGKFMNIKQKREKDKDTEEKLIAIKKL